MSGGKDLEPNEAKPPEELAQGPRHTAALEEHEDTLALEGVIGIVQQGTQVAEEVVTEAHDNNKLRKIIEYRLQKGAYDKFFLDILGK